ncbi:Peptidyl-prolyl cis-trans isomerase FKBP4-like [Oopsacas minuta]|uniref:peptidylprolyl isomerase n=1 Tax=Oopsacas minuta TaxID=111878 RepID=A0AAV7KFP8_9METZ|nr:Peptidyl-prolyl cis-trans isomerase FKBP4-like [Oopsacas minuta]
MTEASPTLPADTEQVVVKAAEHFSADQTKWGEDISPNKDGTLFKKVLQEGEGADTPLNGDKVYVHYEGRRMDQTQFDSSKGSPAPFEVNIGLGQVIKGWDIGIVTMKRGEVCLLTCLPEMAYGGEEFQDTIPPNSTLQFEIELISWHGMYCTKDPGGYEVNVLKSFIREGSKHSAKINDSAEVTVHITGKYKDKVFFKKEDFTFSIDECLDHNIPHGIEFGIKKMKKEEISKVYLPPNYAFGDIGNAELGIPPNASLVYEIQLISFINLKESWEYDSVEERIEAATKFKARGTALLMSDKIDLALQSYNKGYTIVKIENLEEEERPATKDIRIALQLNISLCQAKLLDFSNQHRTCSQILEEDKDNLKALFRRGMAGIEINEFMQSIADFNRVIELDPDNKGAIKLLDHAKHHLKGQAEKEKKLYASMFSKTFTDPTQEEPAANSNTERLMETADNNSELKGDSIDA